MIDTYKHDKALNNEKFTVGGKEETATLTVDNKTIANDNVESGINKLQTHFKEKTGSLIDDDKIRNYKYDYKGNREEGVIS
jgi:uncharacterized protein YjbJ (UPF0337 family)